MNRKILSIAAGLAIFTALLHLFGGTPEIHTPLLTAAMPREIALLLYACWHLVSVALGASAVGLALAARRHHDESLRAMVGLIGLMWIGFGLVFVLVALVFEGPGMLLKLPQWTLLIPIGILALQGARKTAE